MPGLFTVAAQADASTSNSPVETALVATGAGLFFTVVGFLLVTDYMGGRRRILDRTQEVGPLRRFNIRFLFGGDEERFEYHKAHVRPLIVGGVFMIMGGIALLIGLVRDVALLIKAV